MRKTVVEYVYEHAKATPDKTAVIAGGVETSYSRLFALSNAYGSFLAAQGLKKGGVVVTRAAQTLEYVVLYLGVHMAGGVISSLEKSVPDQVMGQVADTVKAQMIISTELSAFEGEERTLVKRDVLADAERFIDSPVRPFPQLEDSADILFTTGTTGKSKGVELSHKALTATAENLIYGCGYKQDTVIIVPGPLNHANPIRKLFTTLVNGSTIVILDGMIDIRAFFRALDTPGSIACCLPPSAVRMIFTLTKDKIGEYADRIDFIESATAPLPETDREHLCRLLPNTRLLNNYGSSESASVCMYDYNKYPGRVGCVGKAMPNSQIVVVNDDREIIHSSKDNMGLLACIGDVNMKGYINEPELTREVLEDGVVFTSDVGYIDDEGFVYISGRKGDVINVGGLKVAPTEVEAAALAMDGIEDCICVPVDNAITGKALKLIVVLREDVPFEVKTIRSFLSTRLEAFKVPTVYEQADHVARTYNGKLDRKAYANGQLCTV